MASHNNDQDPVSEARRFVDCGTCGKVVHMRQKLFAGGVASVSS